jgi:hypothetical protein
VNNRDHPNTNKAIIQFSTIRSRSHTDAQQEQKNAYAFCLVSAQKSAILSAELKI